MGFGFKKKVVYTEEQIKAWVNDQRESGKKFKNSKGEPVQYDDLVSVEEEYLEKKSNGGLSSCQWLNHDKHLFGKLGHNFDERKWRSKNGCEYEAKEQAIFPNYSVHYYTYHLGQLLPWHDKNNLLGSQKLQELPEGSVRLGANEMAEVYFDGQ